MAMRIVGLFLSLLGHAGLIALALWVLPWMRARPEPPVPAIAVSLIGAEDFAALSRGGPEGAVAPSQTLPPTAPEVAPEAPEAVDTPEPTATPGPGEGSAPAERSLAPGFDAVAPLGLPSTDGEPSAAVRSAPRPRPRSQADALETAAPSDALEPAPQQSGNAGHADRTAAGVGGTLGADAESALAAYAAEVHAAIARAQVYPQIARDRGLVGSVRLRVLTRRDGRLINAWLLGSSGSETLDRAALAAARDAQLPPVPDDVRPGSASPSIDVTLEFTLNG